MKYLYVLVLDNGEYWDGNNTTPVLDKAKKYISAQQALYICDKIQKSINSKYIEIKEYKDCVKRS